MGDGISESDVACGGTGTLRMRENKLQQYRLTAADVVRKVDSSATVIAYQSTSEPGSTSHTESASVSVNASVSGGDIAPAGRKVASERVASGVTRHVGAGVTFEPEGASAGAGTGTAGAALSSKKPAAKNIGPLTWNGLRDADMAVAALERPDAVQQRTGAGAKRALKRSDGGRPGQAADERGGRSPGRIAARARGGGRRTCHRALAREQLPTASSPCATVFRYFTTLLSPALRYRVGYAAARFQGRWQSSPQSR